MSRSYGKRLLAVLAILALVVLLVASCAGPAPTLTPTKPPTPGPTPTPAPTPTMLPIKWKMSGYGGPGYPIRVMQEDLVKILAEKSNGQIKVEYFPAESLVTNVQGFDAAKDMLVQIALTSATYEPKRLGIVADIANMPGNFKEEAFGRNYRKPGSFYDWVAPYWEKNGLKLLSWPAVGYCYIFTRKPAHNLEDLKGKMIRTISSVAPFFKAMGIEPSFIAPTELFEAIQRGTVDGGTVALSSIATLHYYEVAPYIIKKEIYTGSLPIIMNLDFYNSLRPDVRKMLDDAVLEAELAYYARGRATFEEHLAYVKAQPRVEIYELPAAEEARWDAIWQTVYPDLAKKWGAEWTEWERVWKTLK